MKELEGYIDFWPEFEANKEITEGDLCFIYKDNELLFQHASSLSVPYYGQCEALITDVSCIWYLGKWKGKSCFAYELSANELNTYERMESKQELEWIGFRDSRWNDDLDLYQIAVKTQHLLKWDKSTKYCGCCGSLYERKEDERAKKCPNCGHLQFPRISPAIIVGIKKGNEILMAHNSAFRPGLYSVIAGFIEQGENIENAVKREVYEEVGIKVKNIQYFQSSPWNSIDSLMLGFIAEYESGEIRIDGKEIVDAKWCDKEHMPEVLPDKISTAWRIINEIMGLEK